MIAPAHAASPILPTGGKFLSGAGVVGMASNGSLNIVQSSGRGIIDWTTFSIGQGGAVSINNGLGATLNKVVGGQLSRIDGSLTATGSIYFVNPQGIVVGASGRVLGGGAVVLSTRDIAGQSFMSGGGLIASGTSSGGVVSQGQIRSSRGDVVLIGRSLNNSGSIDAPAGVVDLAAADTVLMSQVGGIDGVYVAADANATGDVTQAGRIKAAAARLASAGGNVYTLAGNRTGLIEASGTATIDGQVWLTAPGGMVSAAGAVSAVNADGSGGKIVASGKNVALAGTAVFSATGTRGGEVLVGVSAPQAGLADTTTIADHAQIIAGGPGGGGSIETSGHQMTLGAATVTAGKGGTWLTDPTDLTLDTPAAATIVASLNSGANVTEQTTASTVIDPSGAGTTATGPGDIIVVAPIVWSGSGSLTLNAYHSATINAAINGSGGFNVTAGSAISIAAPVLASEVTLSANGGNVSIGAVGSVEGDNGVTVAASANFVNVGGAGAISSNFGRWLIYSTTPASNTLGGLNPNFIQYNATYPAAAAQTTGNGLIYSAPETIGLSLHGTSSKVYDGTTATTIAAANLTATGVLGGDTVAVTGVYATPDVASGLKISTTGLTVTNGAATVYGFTSNVATANGYIGTITPKTLTAAIVGGPTKVYDRSTTATLSSANYQVNGIVSGTLTVNQPSSVAFATAGAGTNIAVNATFARTNFTAGGGLNLIDYTLPTVATGPGTILQAPLQLNGVRATNKVYNQTTSDPLFTSSVALFGVLTGDTVTASTAGAIGTFAQADVGASVAVVASGFTIAGASAANYALIQPTGLKANITPAPLTLNGITANSKPYDGGTVATLNTVGTLNGVISGDTVGYSAGAATGAFAQANVGTGLAVSTTAFTLTGASATDYALTQPSGLTANITPLTLTAAITGAPTKVYDGSTSTSLASSSYTISGFVAGEGATINQVAHLDYFETSNVGSQAITATLAPSDFVATGGTKLTNYILPASAAGTGAITPAPITVQIINVPTKTYDSTTTATVTGSDFRLQGFVTGQGASVSQTSGFYASSNAGPELVTASLTGFLTGTGGALLTNYSFPTTAAGQGLINPAPLTLGVGPPYNVVVGLVGNPTKVYDGTTALTGLTSANFSLLGFQGADTANVTKTSGTFAAADAGIQPVTVSLLTSDYNFTTGVASNYTLPAQVYGTGTITPAPIVATIVNTPTKVYNNSTRAVLSGVNLGVNSGSGAFLFTGFVGSDGVSLTAPILGAYATAGAGSNIQVTAGFNGVNLTATGATNLANYTLPTFAVGPGAISQAPLYVTNVTAQDKVYDTTRTATLNVGSATTFGLVQGDTVTLATNTAVGAFAAPDAGSGVAVAATGFTLSGGASANYALIQPVGLVATISRAPLSVIGLTASNKVYDALTTAALNTTSASLVGVLGPDIGSVSLNSSYTANFSTKNVGTGIGVGAVLSVGGSESSNYLLSQPTGLTANITPAPLTANITTGPVKTYDGSTSTTLKASNYTLTGFVSGTGDAATIPQSATAAYVSANVNIVSGAVSTVVVNSTLVSSDFLATGSTDLSNYSLPTTGTGLGTINPITLTGSIIGVPTKVYDTTNAATLAAANYTLTGFVGSQGATVTETAGTYASANAGTSDLITVSGLTSLSYTPLAGAILTNYILPITLTGPGTITKAPLTITGVIANNKVYDGTRTDTLIVSAAALSGVKGADILSIGSGSATGTFATAGAGTSIAVTTAGFTFSGSQSANYTLTQPSSAANITVKPITLSSVTKIYDGTPSATAASGATYGLSGVVSGDVANVSVLASSVTGTYTTQNVGTGLLVNLGNLGLTGSAAINYSILATANNAAIGIINLKALTAAIVGAPTKPYDTTSSATLTTGNYSLSGFVSGEGSDVAVTKTSGTYASANAGNPDAVTASLAGGDFSTVTTLLSNYALPTTATGVGAITPLTLSASIVNTPTKTYNANTGATLTASNYSLGGFLGGQGATVTQTTGIYASSHASSTDTVTASLVAGNYTATGGAVLTNYVLPTTASGNGSINPAAVTASLLGVTKPYDSTTTASLAPANYTLTGFVGAQGASVSQTVGAYASANAATGDLVTASLAASAFTATGGALLTDYDLPTTASGLGVITPLTLTAAIVGNPTKAYTTTTAATLASANYALTGFIGADAATVIHPVGSYASPNASLTDPVTASLVAGNFTAVGATLLSNYVLPSTASGNGVITPLTVTAAIVNTPTKTYDATAAATLNASNYSLTGFIGGQGASVAQTAGIYASANAGLTDTVTSILSAGNFTAAGATILSNYVLPTSASGAGVINPASLTAAIVNTPTKTYDATTGATLTASNFGLSGFVDGQGSDVTVNQATGGYASANASTIDLVTASLSAGAFNAIVTNLANYVLPTTASGNGVISRASLTAAIIGNPTKTYDATTGATLLALNYSLTGFVGAQGATVTQTTGAYASSHAGLTDTVTASLSAGDFTATGGALFANYTLPTSASGNGVITPAVVTATLSGITKPYDATTTATLAPVDYTLTGFIGAQGALITQTAGTYASANASTTNLVTVSLATGDFTVTGGALLTDYTLPTSATGLGAITPLTLTAAIVNTPTKTYDATTASVLTAANYSLAGFVGGQGASVSQTTGAYASADASPADAVTASLGAGNFTATGGALLANYVLPTTASGNGVINPKSLSVAIVGTPTKTYDAMTGVVLTTLNYGLSGFVGGQGDDVTVSQTAGTYASANASTTDLVTASLSAGAFSTLTTNLANYVLPTSASGNGVINPASLTAVIAGNPTKTYDATTTATLTSTNYSLTGFIGGQGALVSHSTGTYASPDAGPSDTVTVSLAAGDFTATGGALLANYVLPTSASGSGAINPALLSAAIIGAPTKTYDATTGSVLTSSNFGLSGFVGGQGDDVTVNQTTGAYASANAAASDPVTAALSAGNFNTIETNLANYVLPTTAAGNGVINPASLTASIVGNPTKTYDGTTTATLTSANYSLTGFIGAEGASVSRTAGTYASPNASSEDTVTASLAAGDFTGSNGTILSNYVLPTTASGSGVINRALLSAAIVGAPTKTYDTTTTATLTSANYSLTGFVGDETATVTQTVGAYASDHAGSADSVTASLETGNFTAAGGALLSNYVLPTTASGYGVITPAPLSATLSGVTKPYDATTTAALAPANYTLNGFLGGQGASVSRTVGTYASPNASSSDLVTAVLGAEDFTATGGALLTDYVLPTAATGLGVITPLTLIAAIVNTPTKTYDAATGAHLTTSNFGLSGFLAGQGADVTVNQTAGTYASANASTTDLVTASLSAANFNTVETNLANYVLPTSASGNGVINPASLLASIVGNPTKTYDTTTTATLTSANYSITGFVGDDAATVTQTSGVYASAHAGPTNIVTASLASGDLVAGGETNFNNYTLPTTASGAGAITPAAVTATLVGVTKPYDANTTATLAPVNYTLNGFLGGQGATVSQTTGTYASPNASASDLVTASLSAGAFAATGGALLSDYTLPTAATGLGAITQLALTAAIVGNPTKTYDATTAAVLTAANYSLTGFVGGEGASVSQAAGTYASPDTSPTNTVTASLSPGNFAATGGALLANYVLPTTAAGAGVINPASLTAAIVGNPTKPYDTTTTATLTSANYSFAGFIGADTATVTQTTGTYASANASNSDVVTASLAAGNLVAGGETNFNNYTLPTSATGSGSIAPLTLTAAIVNTPTKTYDATTGAVLTALNYSLTGFVGGQGASVSRTVGTYASPNANRTDTVTTSLASGDFSGADGTILANYVLPTTASGIGVINPALLSAAIIGIPTKTYDATTTAVLASANYTLTGFIGGQSASVSQAAGTYASPNASPTDAVTAGLAVENFTAADGTILANYVLPTTASGNGVINPALLSAAIIGIPTKTYDATTTAVLASANYTLTGFIGGQSASVSQAAGTYASPNASPTDAVTAGLAVENFTAADGTILANYVLPTTASGNGVINPALLSAAIIGTPTKPYDATTSATLTSANYALSGLVGGQVIVIGQTAGTYVSPDASGADVVTASLSAGDYTPTVGVLISNYTLPTSTSGNGAITPLTLTASIIGTPTKRYDGATSASLTPANYRLTGFIAGEGATVTATTGAYASAAVGPETVSSRPLTSADYTPLSGVDLANYVLPAGASGPGLIVNNYADIGLRGTLYARLEELGHGPANAALIAREATFAIATPRPYIPFPAPDDLSTRVGNGLGSLPIVIGAGASGCDPCIRYHDGLIEFDGGPDVINATEEILLQGGKKQHWTITLPPERPNAPSLGGH